MKKFIILISVLFSLSLAAEEVSSFNLNGNAKNAINSAFDARIIGKVYPAADRFGHPTGAMYFGGDGYIQSDGMRNYDFGTNFSLSMWVKIDPNDYSSGDRMAIITNGQSNQGTFNIRLTRFENPSVVLNASLIGITRKGEEITRGGGSYLSNMNGWIHIVMTSTSDEITTYVNNVEFMKNINNSYYNTRVKNVVVNYPFNIGNNALEKSGFDNSVLRKDFFHGKIDDIKIYNHTLSVREVDDLYNDYQDGFSLELTNKKNITLVDKETTIPSAVLINNHTLESADIITWSSLTFPNGNTIYKQVIKKYTLPAESERTITTRPIIYSWYPKGDYIFKYYLANENVEGGDIIYDHFTFTKE